MSLVRMNSYWSRAGPSSGMTGALVERRDAEPTQGEGPMTTGGRTRVLTCLQVEECQGLLVFAFRESTALPTP